MSDVYMKVFNQNLNVEHLDIKEEEEEEIDKSYKYKSLTMTGKILLPN